MNYFFTAKWCSQCKLMKPTIEELVANETQIKIVDAEEETDLVKRFDIMSIPTLVNYKEEQLVGLKTKEEIIKFLNGE